jgi:SNF2 family DNA or RNA helicase
MINIRPTGAQEREINRTITAIRDGGGALFAWEPGCGKTYGAIWVTQKLGANRRVIVVCPKRVIPSWQASIKTITGQEAKVLSRTTKAGRVNIESMLNGGDGWWVINFELLVSLQKAVDVGKWPSASFSKKSFDMVVVDEVHRIANHRTQSFRAVKALKSRYRLGLSGTPAGNKPVNIYGVLKFLNPDSVDHSFYRFADEFFVSKMNPFAASRYARIYGGEKDPGALRDSVGDIWSAMRGSEVFGDLPPVNVQRVVCGMRREQKRMYREFVDHRLAVMDGGASVASSAAVLDGRLRQITLGPLRIVGDSVEFEERGSSKIDAVLDILFDLPSDEKVILWCHSRKFMAPLRKRLADAGYQSVELSSDYHDEWRRFLESDGPRILCAVIAAAAEGIDGLQDVCNTEIWLSEDNSVILNLQASARLNRKGQAKRVNRFLLQCENTVDVTAVEPRLAAGYERLYESGLI